MIVCLFLALSYSMRTDAKRLAYDTDTMPANTFGSKCSKYPSVTLIMAVYVVYFFFW